MAKVSLRIYNREIEGLIDQGQTDEAIAHCRHILKTFPKHLETYRMLGKAYLEARRYGEAAEIFGRLLMAVPDDFVAHVGLSIIRDDESKLDDAIWHMERAFEVQSSNAAIQSELQKLYGRRDGMEPPKIRMTRGALARIYVMGELYPQAIAEIRSLLAEDPQRVDMQVLLAHSYLKSGQRADADEICNQLLKRYLYCFDANRIKVDLLPASAGAESTQVYRMRLSEMDPYTNFVKGSIFQTADVPDASISLERHEYTGEEIPMAQDWNKSSLGFSSIPQLGATPATNEQPDWLRSTNEEQAAPASFGAVATPSNEAQLPDFLRDAGWGSATGPETPTSIFDEEPAADIVQADIPEWLKSQQPQTKTSSEPAASIETPDYLSNLDTSFDPFSDVSAPAQTPDWLKDTESDEADDADTSTEMESDTPDWLSGLGAEVQTKETTPASDVPDWLAGLDVTPKSEAASSGETTQFLAGLSDAAGLALGASTAIDADIPEWLRPEEPAQAQTVASQPAPSVESLGASAQEQDDAVAWLESLAAKHGAKPEELVTDPNKRSETPPEWVAQAQNIGEKASVESEPVKSEWSENAASIGEEFFAEFEKASTSASMKEESSDINWDEEEPPLERGSIPEWLKDAEPVVSDRRPSSLNTSSLPGWLEGLDEPAHTEAAFEKEEALVHNQDLSDWLSGLDDEPGLDIDPQVLRAPEQPLAIGAPPTQPADELPDWMGAGKVDELQDEDWQPPVDAAQPEPVELKEEVVETAPVAAASDLPEWLQQEDNVAEDDDNTPPWVHREQWEEAQSEAVVPVPTTPSDWQPVVAAKQKEDAPRRDGVERLAQSEPEPADAVPATISKKKAPVKQQGLPRADTQGTVTVLGQAKSELDRGDIPEALAHYGKLIKKGKHLEEVIGNLTDSLYRYPVEVGIWQALGDAYMRANRLKEALEAYNKAEELIR